MVALIFGIISIVCCVLSWLGISWLSFIGLICGIVAWAVGASAVKANPADGQAKAGKIIAPRFRTVKNILRLRFLV